MPEREVADDLDPNGPGPSPEGPTKEEEWRRLAQLRDRVRAQLGSHEQWIVEEFETIEKELSWVRSRLFTPRKGQPTLWFTSAGEVLKAVDGGVATRMEARKILGLRGKKLPRVPARRAPARRMR
jgi:hypothetical protein